MLSSRFMPCPDCGDSLDREDPLPHICDQTRLLEFQLQAMRAEVARFEEQFAAYLASPEGRFEAWYARSRVG